MMIVSKEELNKLSRTLYKLSGGKLSVSDELVADSISNKSAKIRVLWSENMPP